MANSKIHKTGGLLDQWTLLSEIIADPRTRKPHIQIAQIVIDRQKEKHGNGRASVRYLERGTGLSKWRLSKATAELAEWGYFTRRPGIGTRPSEFTAISWPSVRVQRDTSELMLVSESGGTRCPSPEGHYDHLVSESGGTNPAYVDGLQAGLREAECSVGAATPPHAAGLSAPSRETPPGRESATDLDAPAEGFAGLWDAFDLKLTNSKPKAKAAYGKLAPDAVLHATVVKAAARLHAHYEEHATERRYRIQCHNWINARGWEDDLPIVYADAKGAAISKTRGSAKPIVASPTTSTPAKPKPAVRTTARITSADVVKEGDTTKLRISARDGHGSEHERILLLEDDDAESQFEGQRQLARLVHAAGLEQIDDSVDLLGRTVILTGNTDVFAAPTTRPDDEPPLPTRPEPVRYAKPSAAPPVSRARELSPAEEAERADYDAWYEASLRDNAA